MTIKRNLQIKIASFSLVIIFIVLIIKVNKENPEKSYKEAVREFLENNRHWEVDEEFVSDNETNDNAIKIYEPTLILRELIRCRDKESFLRLLQHGEFWILKNYVKGSVTFQCFESITYTTHAEFRYLDNVIPLLERWKAPLSLAIYAPGNDFQKTLESIAYLRKCHIERDLVVRFATFHIFLESEHRHGSTPLDFQVFETGYECPNDPPYENVTRIETYKEAHNLTYPVNVARNLARDAAVTHFVLASDIELYPNPGIIDDFFKMIVANPFKHLEERNVFVLPIVEVQENSLVPRNKSELIQFFSDGVAIWFHHSVCSGCHMVPEAKKWIGNNDITGMKVFSKSKRTGKFASWEPLYIGTNKDPFYDERLSWENRKDKMTQAYVMCVLDYTFNVLSNAFLVHKPGIKTKSEAQQRSSQGKTNTFFQKTVRQEMGDFYGTRNGCKL